MVEGGQMGAGLREFPPPVPLVLNHRADGALLLAVLLEPCCGAVQEDLVVATVGA